MKNVDKIGKVILIVILIFIVVYVVAYILIRNGVIVPNVETVDKQQVGELNEKDNNIPTFEQARALFESNGYYIIDNTIAQNGNEYFYAFLLSKDGNKYLSTNINVDSIVEVYNSHVTDRTGFTVNKTGFSSVKMENNLFYISYIQQRLLFNGRDYVKSYKENKIYSDGSISSTGAYYNGNPL